MRRAILLITVVALVSLAGSVGAVSASSPNSALAQLRAATARYHDPAAAIADGYVATEECVEVPGIGAMGYHYVNFALLDANVELLEPEGLLYIPTASGPRLVAVEWVTVDVGQPHPYLLGVAFDGPMPGHSPGMPVHYDLHGWIWQANRAGLFAQFNPSLSC
jgi:hypothetical protein